MRLFLSPNGRMPARPFWTGVAILAPINMIAATTGVLSPGPVQLLAGLIGWLTVYPWLCVCAKRLHDAGRTAALVLLPVAAVIVVGTAVSMTIMAPFMADAMRASMAETHGPTALNPYGPGTPAHAAALTSALITIPAGWLIYGLFLLWTGKGRHDPESNRFGPAEDATAV